MLHAILHVEGSIQAQTPNNLWQTLLFWQVLFRSLVRSYRRLGYKPQRNMNQGPRTILTKVTTSKNLQKK
eukprot:1710108-Amphidinium_carterae.1